MFTGRSISWQIIKIMGRVLQLLAFMPAFILIIYIGFRVGWSKFFTSKVGWLMVVATTTALSVWWFISDLPTELMRLGLELILLYHSQGRLFWVSKRLILVVPLSIVIISKINGILADYFMEQGGMKEFIITYLDDEKGR